MTTRLVLAAAIASLALSACGADEKTSTAAKDADSSSAGNGTASVFWDGGTIEDEYVAGAPHFGNSYIALSVEDGEVKPGSVAEIPAKCGDRYVRVIQDLSGEMPLDEGTFTLTGSRPQGSTAVVDDLTITGEVTEHGRASGTATMTGVSLEDGGSGETCDDVELDVTVLAPLEAAPLEEPVEAYFGSGDNGDPVAIRLTPDHQGIVTARAQHAMICPPSNGKDVLLNSYSTSTVYEPADIAPDGTFKLEDRYATTNAQLTIDGELVPGGGTLFTTISGRLDGGQIVDATYSAYLDWFEGFTPGVNGTGTAKKGARSYACGIEGEDGEPTDESIQLDLAG